MYGEDGRFYWYEDAERMLLELKAKNLTLEQLHTLADILRPSTKDWKNKLKTTQVHLDETYLALMKDWEREQKIPFPLYDCLEELNWPWKWNLTVNSEDDHELFFHGFSDNNYKVGAVWHLDNKVKAYCWTPFYMSFIGCTNIIVDQKVSTVEKGKVLIETAFKTWLREHTND